MSIQGSLKSFPIPDLFSLILHMRKTGVLTIVTESEERGFLFSGGNIINATTQDDSKRLGSYLVKLGFLKDRDLKEVFGESSRRGPYFGQRILELGRLTKKQLHRAVKAQVIDILEEVVGWPEGAFHFDDADLPFEVPDAHLVATQSVILEITQKSDEIQKARKLIKDGRAIYEVSEFPAEGEVTPKHHQVINLVDGKRTVYQLVNTCPLGPLETVIHFKDLISKRILRKCAVKKRGGRANSVPDLKSLPISPDVAARLFSIFNFSEGRILESKILETLSRQPLLMAKLLKMMTLKNILVGRADMNISRLIKFLSIFNIRRILIPEAARGFFFPQEEDLGKELWRHSYFCACLCRKMAEEIGYPYPEEAYVGGLLHNLGAFLLLHHSPSRYQRVLSDSAHYQRDIEELEEEAFGITHTKLGGKYSDKWSFPMIISLIVKNHHKPSTGVKSPILHMIRAASGILYDRGLRIGHEARRREQVDRSLDQLKLSREDLEGFFRALRRERDGQASRRRSVVA